MTGGRIAALIALSALVLGLLAVAVFWPSGPERALSLCRERRVVLDALYARYGGHQLIEAAEIATSMPLTALRNEDIRTFEAKCQSIGVGQRPDIYSEKARAFFADPANQAACQQVVDMQREIADINATLDVADQVNCL